MRTCLTIALIFFFLYSASQTETPLQFRRIDGLSQNTVYSLMKDRKGFLWIATGNGLNRYDGSEMKIYKPSFTMNSGSMQGRIIRSDMMEDDNELIWFSTDITLHCFNKKNEKFTAFYLDRNLHLITDGSKGIPLFTNILLIKDSLIWLANSALGVFSLNRFTLQVKRFPITHRDEAGNTINIMYNGVYDGNDMFWFATKKGLLGFHISKGSWQYRLRGYPFYSVVILNDTLYACWGKEIFNIDTRNFSLHRSVVEKRQPSSNEPEFFRRLYKDEFAQIWAGDENGNIFLRKKDGNTFEWKGNINDDPKPATNYPVYCIFNFDNQNLWVGGDIIGLQKSGINGSIFDSYPGNAMNGNGIGKLFIHSILEDNSGKVWLGTFQKGLFILDKKNNSMKEVKLHDNFKQIYYNKSVPLIKQDSKGNLWTSMSGQLFIRQAGDKNFSSIKFPVPSNSLQEPQMWSLTEYKNGWIIGTNIGFYYIIKKDKDYIIYHLKHLGLQRMSDAWVGPDGSLWLMPQTGGIWIINNLDSIEKPKKIFEQTNVRSIYHDTLHSLLWISSASGLIAYHLPGGQFKVYTEEDGMLNSFVYGVLPHGSDLWISTNKGLSKAATDYRGGRLFPAIRFSNFTTNNGLPSNEFNTGAFFKSKSGCMYFGSESGVTWFKPEDIKLEQDIPVIQITEININDEKADPTLAPEYISNLLLPWHKNNLHFRFRAIDYGNASGIKYMYKLQGLDKDWVYSNNLNEVRYNELPAGNYIFKIKASNRSGVWYEMPYGVTVNIKPPFWKTWWFITNAIIIFIAATIFITHKLAQRRLKQRVAELERQRFLDKERQRISREMHDDIGAGLTQIVLMSESAKMKSTDAVNKELSDIADTSRVLVSNMSEIIWSLNPENKSLEELLSYLRENLNKQLEYTGINYSVEIPETGKEIRLSNEQMRNILQVAKETVNNAIKHSKAVNINVKVSYNEGILQIDVTDDGVGFDSQKKYLGNGLRNISQRIKEIGGEIAIESSSEKGSRFIFIFPVNTTKITY